MKLFIVQIAVLILDIIYSVKAYMDHAYIYLTGDIICALVLTGLSIYNVKQLYKSKQQSETQQSKTETL